MSAWKTVNEPKMSFKTCANRSRFRRSSYGEMLTGACNKSEISVPRVFDRQLAAFSDFATVSASIGIQREASADKPALTEFARVNPRLCTAHR
jgi:hypothetical protein